MPFYGRQTHKNMMPPVCRLRHRAAGAPYRNAIGGQTPSKLDRLYLDIFGKGIGVRYLDKQPMVAFF